MPRELDFPYYSLQNGFGSTLNLVSDSPAPLDFTLSVHARSGLTLVAPKKTIQPQAKFPIDMAALLKGLGADATGDFSEGSVSLNFVGTIMPLVGQMTTTNPALRLVHESEMVENDPGRTDIPAILEGLWWNISGGRDAQVMVTNMSNLRASADVFLDFSGTRHPSVVLNFRPHELKTVSIIQLLADLNTTPSQVPEGGITIIQREFTPTLIAQGKVLDPATGFSTTLSFPDPARERSNSLHASGVPIGTPTKDSPFAGTGYFIPHVVVRNLIGAPQTVSINVEYPKGSAWNSAEAPGGSAIPTVDMPVIHNAVAGAGPAPALLPDDLTGQFALAPVSVAPYSTLDYSLDSIMGQLPLPIPYCSIRIQYSGAPGSALAQVSSVETKSDMVIDAAVANEGDGWHGSGANPWHLDNQTESILFLTDEGDKPVRIGFSVTAGEVHYQLTTLKLAPHETRAIDIRKLRDAQQADYQRSKIPADASDGSVYWTRLDNTPVMGRLVVIQRHNGMASSYDCCPCRCPSDFTSTGVSTDPPNVPPILPGQTCQHYATAAYRDCNFVYSYYDVTLSSTWLSSSTSVATVDGTGLVTGVSPGTPTISANYSDFTWNWSVVEGACVDTPRSHTGSASCPVQAPTISGPNTVWWFNGQTQNGYATSIQLTASPTNSTSYTWSTVNGILKINNSGGNNSTVTITGQALSDTSGDVSVQVAVVINGVSSNSAPFSLTVRGPKLAVVIGSPVDSADPNTQWSSLMSYTILDNLNQQLPSTVGLNENWTSVPANQYPNCPNSPNPCWPRGAPVPAVINNSTFGDIMAPPLLSTNPFPTPTGPGSGSTLVENWGQEWRVGSLTAGNGARIQTDTQQFYLDHGRHLNIVSPAP